MIHNEGRQIMALNNVIKKRLSELNMKNKELSDASGVPLRTINNILAGITDNPGIETVRAIAHAIGFTLDDIAEEVSSDVFCFTASERQLLSDFKSLSAEGQELLLQRAAELVRLGYIKNSESELVEA